MPPTRQHAPRTLDLLEEAMYCLRRAPLSQLAVYYLGSIPFVLGLLYFWTDMSHNARATEHCLRASLGLAVLFIWMKSWHAVWASQLREHLSGRPPTGWTLRRSVRLVLTQALCQPWWFAVMPVACLVLMPMAWAHNFFQNLLVLGDGSEASLIALWRRASQQALLWHRQSVLVLLNLGVFGMVVLANVGISLAMLPYLLKMLLGIESVFTRHSGALSNSTFLAIVVGITALLLGPFSKTLYVLRCFYGESLQNGEDLQATLRRLLPGRVLVAWFIILNCGAGAWSTSSAEIATTRRTEQLDQALDTVLQQREYVWRLPRSSSMDADRKAAVNFFTAIAQTLTTWLQTISQWINKLLEWLRHFVLTPEQPRQPQSTARPALVLWGVTGVVLLLGFVVLWYLWWPRRVKGPVPATVDTASPPDDDHLMADALPVQGWWTMAQELVQRGDLRMATRAFYLASLASLAQQNLVTLAAHKSSRDYQRELRRRAYDRPQLLGAFGQNATTFERVWYGHYAAPSDVVQQFTLTHERIQAGAQK